MSDPVKGLRNEGDRDQLLMDAIMACDNGQILNIVQAARELPGSVYDRLSAAYHEITGTDGDPDAEIKLR